MLKAHNWQKWKSTFHACPRHKIYRVEAVGLKKFQLYLSNYDFCENVKFGAILWKFDILSTTAWLKFESKIPFARMWHISIWLSAACHISFLPNWFSVENRFPFYILQIFTINYLAMLRDRFLKKMLLERAKTHWLFFPRKPIGSSNTFTLLENNFRFLK